jgi:hypothetical protein
MTRSHLQPALPGYVTKHSTKPLHAARIGVVVGGPVLRQQTVLRASIRDVVGAIIHRDISGSRLHPQAVDGKAVVLPLPEVVSFAPREGLLQFEA